MFSFGNIFDNDNSAKVVATTKNSINDPSNNQSCRSKEIIATTSNAINISSTIQTCRSKAIIASTSHPINNPSTIQICRSTEVLNRPIPGNNVPLLNIPSRAAGIRLRRQTDSLIDVNEQSKRRARNPVFKFNVCNVTCVVCAKTFATAANMVVCDKCLYKM